MKLSISFAFVLVFSSANSKFILGPTTFHGTQDLKEPSAEDIHFLLYTNENGLDNPVEVELNSNSLMAAGYKPDRPTIILSHGFSSNGIGHGRRFAEAYFAVGEYNVFTIDWEKLATWTNYFAAVGNTRFVADESVKLVILLHNNGGVANVHLVGHSLGAHVVGFIGKNFQNQGYGTLPKITGLDPAQPGFELALSHQRLDKSDAEYVQVIHTNSGLLWDGCLSISKQIGHMDFYPAGGAHQPGCTDLCLAGYCTENDINDLVRGGCSHDRANQFFVESILKDADEFLAWECIDWTSFEQGLCCPTDNVVMGDRSERIREGKYFLTVNEDKPYAMGNNGNFC